MNKLPLILLDGLILFAVSTVVVVVADNGFSTLKGKTPKDDPLVTAILQEDLKALENKFGDGAPSATQTDEHGRTALMRAAYVNLSDAKALASSDAKRAAMIPLLIQNGASPNSVDKDGWSALMWASWSGLPKVAGTLIEQGASPNLADHQGNTALTLAAMRGNAETVKLLLDRGADKSALTRKGQTALGLAKAGIAEYPDKKAHYQQIIQTLQS